MKLDKNKCKERVSSRGPFRRVNPPQCQKKIWKDGFCKQHHPDTSIAKEEIRDKRLKTEIKKLWLEKHAGLLLEALEALVDRLEDEIPEVKRWEQMKQAKSAKKAAKGEQ